MNKMLVDELFGPFIYSYTRAQAIADGELVDVSQVAKGAGFKFPVAITARVWAEVVTPDPSGRENGQSEQGRLWDVLQMLLWAIRKGQGCQEVNFSLYVIQKAAQKRLVHLKALCGPGDEGEPVITIMYPEQD